MNEHLTQTDIINACIGTFLMDLIRAEASLDIYPALRKFAERCETLPEFRATYTLWDTPAVR